MRPSLLGVWTADELQVALIRTACGDPQLEPALQLVVDEGPSVFALLAAGLLRVQPDVDELGGGLWAEIEWSDIEDAVARGALRATPTELTTLRGAATLAGMVPGP